MQPNRHYILLLAVALALRLWLLAEPLWYDENFTLLVSRLPFEQMLVATAGDVHPPLWYVISWLAAQVSDAPAFLRLPALVFSMLAIPVARAILDELQLHPITRQVALWLMAIAPMQLFYAGEARMYSLLQFLFLLGVLAALRGQFGRAGLSAAALAYTHNWGLFYSAALFALLAWQYRKCLRRVWLRLVAPFVGAALAWLPWGAVLLWQMTDLSGSYWITRVTFGQAAYQVHQQFWAWSQPWPHGIAATFGLLLFGLWLAVKQNQWRVIWLALAPLGLAALVSLAWQPVLLFRAQIGSDLFLYTLAALPVADLWREGILQRRRALVIAIFILPAFIIGLGGYLRGGARDNMLHILGMINARWQAGDAILVINDGPVVNLSPYLAPDQPIYMLPECQPSLGALSPQTRAALGVQPYNGQPVGRAWVIWAVTPLVHQCELDYMTGIIAGGEEVYSTENEDLIRSGVWLVSR